MQHTAAGGRAWRSGNQAYLPTASQVSIIMDVNSRQQCDTRPRSSVCVVAVQPTTDALGRPPFEQQVPGRSVVPRTKRSVGRLSLGVTGPPPSSAQA